MDLHPYRSTLSTLASVALLAACAEAQTAASYTTASGYVQVTVPGNTLGAISATLQNKSDHTSNATVNNDWLPLDNRGTPQTTDDIPARQTLTVTGAAWTAGQWTTSSYLCYVCDSIGGEEAFLILSHTATSLTIATEFNLLDPARSIPTTASISIRRAQTVGGLFGVGAGTAVNPADKVYLWNGAGWTTYFVDNNGTWRKIGSFFPANNDAVYADEGMFVQRNIATPITFTFFGDVPGKAQVTTMPGPGLLFVSSRYPVQTTVGQLGFQNLPNWQQGSGGDLVYLWNGTAWVTYFYQAPNWRKIGSFFSHQNDPIAPDSALFVSRKGVSSLAQSANRHALPYTP